MPENTTKPTFGSLLSSFRKQAFDKRARKGLSQKNLADKISDELRFDVGGRNKVGNWEANQKLPLATSDRSTLIAIITVLHNHNGLKTLEDANQLLASGNYGLLSDEEIVKIDVAWKTIPLNEADKGQKNETAPSTETVKEANVHPVTVTFEPGSVLPVVIRRFSPGSAPPVPSMLIGRDEDMQNLKIKLGIGGTTKPSFQVLTAIKGWPGVGKTTIASALAHDAEIITAFPDGVLWTSLGQEPNILSEMATWGRALGTDEILKARSVEEAQRLLAGLLRSKRMLLIIDDVWKVEDGFPFKVGGPNCATLMTTRLDGIANALAPTAANIYRLKVLKDDDAFELIRQLAPTVVEQYPNECLVLVHELEGLPLALQVAGRLLNTEANYGGFIKQLITDLRAGAKLLEAIAPDDRTDLVNETTPTIATLLQKSLDLLDDVTKDCYAYLGVFAPKPATFDMEAMKSVWQVEDPSPIIKTLVDRGLLEFVPALTRYQMHAVLVMLAKSLLTDDE